MRRITGQGPLVYHNFKFSKKITQKIKRNTLLFLPTLLYLILFSILKIKKNVKFYDPLAGSLRKTPTWFYLFSIRVSRVGGKTDQIEPLRLNPHSAVNAGFLVSR